MVCILSHMPKTIPVIYLFAVLAGLVLAGLVLPSSVRAAESAAPATLRVYEDTQEQVRAKKMFYGYINNGVARAAKQRQQELAALKTPDQWRQRQQQTRLRLEEYLGGVWALSAAAFDARPAGVICVNTVPSYKLIVGSRYYNTRDYFWVPAALKDFDLPDLIGLVAPRPAVLIDPRDALLKPLARTQCRDLCHWARGAYHILGKPQGLRVIDSPHGTTAQIATQVDAAMYGIALESR